MSLKGKSIINKKTMCQIEINWGQFLNVLFEELFLNSP